MSWLSKLWKLAYSLLSNEKGIAWLPILLALGGGYLLSSLFGGEKDKKEVSGDYPEGEVLGEYPGGLMTFETLTPDQKKIMQSLMSYMMPKLGLPGQAFGQAPAGTTAGAGLGAGGGQGALGGIGGMLTSLLGGGGSPTGGGSSSTCRPRVGGR